MKKLLILILAISLSGCSWIKGGDKTPKDVKVYSDTHQVTPMGVNIYSKNGTDISGIDETMAVLFNDAQRLGYTNMISFSDYSVFVLDNCEDRNGVPSFRMRADSYDGTVYDINPETGVGEIYASEYVIMDWMGYPTNSFVVCSGNATVTVRYGAEHIILFNNNRDRYEETKIHFTGGHPLF